ncbi:serine/threonine-protein kinase [Actinoplanes sp. NPDC051851]|uniref:serine/threonine protein kinase n=1 Tax=Actinoplanes sp. NPDC051851 TaxID=3154753 RepID=UPI003440BB29
MSMPLRPGDPRSLGRFELLGRLGEGGMGSVFLGRGPDGRNVAIKTVRPEYAHEPEFRGRFRSEVNRARQVPPFSTAEVLDADPDHEPPYLVVEYVDGPSLAAEIRENGPLAGAALHGVAVGIATALTAIHGTGVIHRDLKPGNVLFARGGIKVIDFGIARAFEATSQHTRTDQMVGTVAYMAPERFDPSYGDPVSPAADIFAWGAVVAYAATGRTPFAGDNASATAIRILTQPPDLTGVPESLRPAVERALAKAPAERPTAREILDSLLAGGLPAATPTASVPGLAAPALAVRSGRSGKRAALAAALVVLLGVAGIGGLHLYHQLSTPAAAPFDEGAVPTASASVAPTVAVSSAAPAGSAAPGSTLSPSERNAAILRGSRKTLIHVAEIDRDLALDVEDSEVRAGDGTGLKSEFALDPLGVDYLIRSLRDPDEEDGDCLGVKIVLDETARLVPTECAATEATLFSLLPVGAKDDKNRPTYYLYNEKWGYVQWSDELKVIFVEVIGDAPPASTFSFVDRGDYPG